LENSASKSRLPSGGSIKRRKGRLGERIDGKTVTIPRSFERLLSTSSRKEKATGEGEEFPHISLKEYDDSMKRRNPRKDWSVRISNEKGKSKRNLFFGGKRGKTTGRDGRKHAGQLYSERQRKGRR